MTTWVNLGHGFALSLNAAAEYVIAVDGVGSRVRIIPGGGRFMSPESSYYVFSPARAHEPQVGMCVDGNLVTAFALGCEQLVAGCTHAPWWNDVETRATWEFFVARESNCGAGHS